MKPKSNPRWKNDTRDNNLNSLTEYDVYIGQARKERDSWKIAFFIAIGFVLCTIPGWIYLGSLPQSVPHVIEIAQWGEARYHGPVGTSTSNIIRTDTSIRYYLRDFLTNLRTVSSDKLIIQERLTRTFRFVTNTGYGILQTIIPELDHFNRANTTRTDIEIESILLLNDRTYQIDWIEDDHRLSNGQLTARRRYRGVFTLAFIDPDDQQIITNPLGIFVDSFEIQELQL